MHYYSITFLRKHTWC